MRKDLIEELTDIACTKYLVNIGKLLRLFRWEVWCKDAIWHAFSP
jgi:hypothetical protein